MENQKNNKVIIALVGVIIVILVVFCILFTTGTITFKSSNNSNNNNKEITNENNEIIVSETELNKFGKSDYNIIKSETLGSTSFNLDINGKININFTNNISNLSNVKDIMLFNRTAPSSILYILTNDGNIFSYDTANIETNNYNATKINEYSNINKIIIYRTRKANAGGCNYAIIIDNNGEYYKLDSSCI